VISLELSVTNAVTKDRIIQIEKQKAEETMKSLIEADRFEELEFGDENKIKYNMAVKGGNTVGYVFETSANGYGGAVSIMTAVNTNGTVKSVAILDVSNETPGLGQNAQKESFYSQYEGKKIDIILVKNSADSKKNEVDAMTGATITSNAVTEAVNLALEQFDVISKNTEGGVQ
jgi:electron transport complex protein RnfG